MFLFWNLNNDTVTVIAVGSRLFVYARNSEGPSLKPVELHAYQCLSVVKYKFVLFIGQCI
jgi:hypothetical protein